MKRDIILAGVGGQGILSIATVIGDAVLNEGLYLKQAEVHGMSQRGGSVSSDVRFGKKVFSPMIPKGEADYLVAVSEDQIDVCGSYLKQDGIIIRPTDIDPQDAASKMLNIAMLGKLNSMLKFPEELWFELIRGTFKPEVAEANIAAFLRAQKGN